MAQLGGTFDSSTVEPNAPREPLPTGWYAMSIVKSEIKESSKNPANKYLQLELEIDETRHPEHKGRRAWAMINLWNANPTASEIAQRDLSGICRAVGVPTVDDSEQLHHKPMAVRLTLIPARGEYAEKNEIKGYAPIADKFGKGAAPSQQGASSGTSQTAATSGKAPWATT